jgi:23S rRNA pseudouridine1911/1915/1917 synthase
MSAPLRILYEDNHLLAVLKPAGLATMGVAADQPSVVTLARQYIKERYSKPGNVYLGVVSRLDEPVSGVLLLARTSKAAARLSVQFRGRSVEKSYWAVVEGSIQPPVGNWHDWLAKDEQARRMRRVARLSAGRPKPGAGPSAPQEARLEYRLLQRLSANSLVEVMLETGRKHQIRVQFAERGWPILGDRRYGAAELFSVGIALHARRLVFDHPVTKQRIELLAPLPRSWRRFGIREGTLGGGGTS